MIANRDDQLVFTADALVPEPQPEFISGGDELEGCLVVKLLRLPPLGSGLEFLERSNHRARLVAPSAVAHVNVGGGGFRQAPSECLRWLSVTFSQTMGPGVGDFRAALRAWLGQVVESLNTGALSQGLFEAAVAILLPSRRVFVWRVGANGFAQGAPGHLRIDCADTRFPSVGATFVPAPPRPVDRIGGLWCFGQDSGHYESRMLDLTGRRLVLFDEAALPFGPWPDVAQDEATLLSLPSGRHYGLPGFVFTMGTGDEARTDASPGSEMMTATLLPWTGCDAPKPATRRTP